MPSDNDPVVSVILPVYNGGAWLEECICSVLTKTLGKVELIIVDDAST